MKPSKFLSAPPISLTGSVLGENQQARGGSAHSSFKMVRSARVAGVGPVLSRPKRKASHSISASEIRPVGRRSQMKKPVNASTKRANQSGLMRLTWRSRRTRSPASTVVKPPPIARSSRNRMTSASSTLRRSINTEIVERTRLSVILCPGSSLW